MKSKSTDGSPEPKANPFDREPLASKDDPALDPYEINFLPQFQHGRGPRNPFVNSSGVVIGDHQYDSQQSPLNNWTTDTDPAVMSGDEWVHPFKDIGFLRDVNRDYFENGIPPQSGIFMHPDKDAGYAAGLDRPKKDTDSELES